MLHILLLILKVIGIILAVILGILVLLVCIVVFVPVRYEVNGRAGGKLSELKVKGKVTWLFSLVRADIYFKENKLKWRLRIAWKKILGGQEYGADADPGGEPAKDDKAQNKKTEGGEDEENWRRYGSDEEGEGGEESDGEAWRDEPEEGGSGEEGAEKVRLAGLREDEGGEEGAEKAGQEEFREDDEDEESEKSHEEAWPAESAEGRKNAKKARRWPGKRKKTGRIKKSGKKRKEEFGEDEELYREILESLEEEYPDDEEAGFEERGAGEERSSEGSGGIKGLIEKIKGIFSRIKCTIRGICDKIKELLEKKNRLLAFIRDETHAGAFRKAKKEVFKLLGRLKPKKFLLEARFGFDDPALTGQVLAALAVLYPCFGTAVSLCPDFAQRTFKGKLYIKGRIRFCHFAAAAWNLFWSRNVRRTYKDIRNFQI